MSLKSEYKTWFLLLSRVKIKQYYLIDIVLYIGLYNNTFKLPKTHLLKKTNHYTKTKLIISNCTCSYKYLNSFALNDTTSQGNFRSYVPPSVILVNQWSFFLLIIIIFT